MKILLVSDTHGLNGTLKDVIKKERPFDYLIHCGDTDDGWREVERMAGTLSTIVRGNNDFDRTLPDVAELVFCGIRLIATHGHRLGVSYGHEGLVREAKARHAAIACYGHTHRPVIEERPDGLLILNPGSLTYPRQADRKPSYIILEVEEGKAPKATLRHARRKGGESGFFY